MDKREEFEEKMKKLVELVEELTAEPCRRSRVGLAVLERGAKDMIISKNGLRFVDSTVGTSSWKEVVSSLSLASGKSTTEALDDLLESLPKMKLRPYKPYSGIELLAMEY